MSQTIQALLSEQDIEEIDKLVKQGIFPNREYVIRTAVKILVSQQASEIENMRKGMSIVNDFLMDNVGDLPWADEPTIEVWNGIKVYRYPIRTEYNKKVYNLGYISLDAKKLEIIKEISESKEKIIEVAESIEDTDDKSSVS